MQAITTTSVYSKTSVFDIEGMPYKAILFRSCHDPFFTDTDCTSLFQSKAYHSALESAPPEKMDFWYVILEQADDLAGMLSFQVKDFNPGDSLKNQVNGSIVRNARYKAASLINLSVLCLGNTLVTGDYGFCFRAGIAERLKTMLMMNTIDWMLTLPEFRKIGLVFVKDFYKDIFSEIPGSPYCSKYHAIDTQPSMIMDLPAGWGSLKGYLGSLKSKYRVRANKALGLSKTLECI
jgi:hypothetical protein